VHGYSNGTSVGDTKRLDILQWQVVVSLGNSHGGTRHVHVDIFH